MWWEYSEQYKVVRVYWMVISLYPMESYSLFFFLSLYLCVCLDRLHSLSLSLGWLTGWLAGQRRCISKIYVCEFTHRDMRKALSFSVNFSKLYRTLFSFCINVFSFIRFSLSLSLSIFSSFGVVTPIQKHGPPSTLQLHCGWCCFRCTCARSLLRFFVCILNFSAQNNRTVLFLIPNKWIAVLFHLRKIFRTKPIRSRPC